MDTVLTTPHPTSFILEVMDPWIPRRARKNKGLHGAAVTAAVTAKESGLRGNLKEPEGKLDGKPFAVRCHLPNHIHT